MTYEKFKLISHAAIRIALEEAGSSISGLANLPGRPMAGNVAFTPEELLCEGGGHVLSFARVHDLAPFVRSFPPVSSGERSAGQEDAFVISRKRRRMASTQSEAAVLGFFTPPAEAAVLDPVSHFFNIYRSPDRGASILRHILPSPESTPDCLIFRARDFNAELRLMPNPIVVQGGRVGSLGDMRAAIDVMAPDGTVRHETYPFVCKVGGDAEIQREIAMMEHLERPYNPHVMRYVFSYLQADGQRCLVMGRVDHGDLYSFIRRLNRTALTVPQRQLLAVHILYQIADGLVFVHSQHTAHLDIKPSNLLMTRNSVVKVADFGLSQPCGPDDTLANFQYVGTLGYLAPELHTQLNFEGTYEMPSGEASQVSDVWSAGVVFLQLLTSEFDSKRVDKNQDNPMYFGRWANTHRRSSHLTSEISNVLFKMLDDSVGDRFKMSHVRDWCRDYILREAAAAPADITLDFIEVLYARVHATPL